MNKNDQILDELFNKDNFDKRLEKNLPKYKPVTATSNDAIFINDPKEVNKRLTGALGVVIGNNTVKSMADKSIKRFPIIVSDDLSPETTVMLKSFIEEQYCNDLALLISNMIIDINKFKSNNKDGNIALQALDVVSGTDFSKNRIARSALNGTLDTDTLLKNTPMYQLLKTESFADSGYTTGDADLDAILSEAVIVPSEVLNEYLMTVTNSAISNMLNEDLNDIIQDKKNNPNSYTNDNIVNTLITSGPGGNKHFLRDLTYDELENFAEKILSINKSKLTKAMKDKWKELDNITDGLDKEVQKRDYFEKVMAPAFGFIVAKDEKDPIRKPNATPYEKYGAFTNSGITQRAAVTLGLDRETKAIADKYYNDVLAPLKYTGAKNTSTAAANMETSEIRSLADCLALPENEIIRDRLNKALYLLSSQRIAGTEFIAYACDRLGLPIGPQTRRTIISKYPIEQISILNRNISGKDGYKFEGNNKVHGKMRDYRTSGFHTDPNSLTGDKANDIINAIDSGISLDAEVYKIGSEIYRMDWRKALKHTGVGTLGGVATGSVVALFVTQPWALPVLAGGAAIGGLAGLISYLVTRKNKIREQEKIKGQIDVANLNRAQTHGWERVEMLIDQLDHNYLNVKRKYSDVYATRNDDVNQMFKLHDNKKLEIDTWNTFNNKMNSVYTAAITNRSLRECFEKQINGETLQENLSSEVKYKLNTAALAEFGSALFEMSKDVPDSYNLDIDTYLFKLNLLKEAFNDYPELSEAFSVANVKTDKTGKTEIVISSKNPITYQKLDVEYKNKSFEPLIVPEFTGRDMKAYGSVEFDRKTIRDRRYNEPLFMTVRFKTRFADDKFKDSELTAVIGVLGVVTAVPSEEMEIILKQNAGIDTEHNAIELIGDKDMQGVLASVLSKIGKNNYMGKLEKSGALWQQLSKVTQLALANKLAGKNSNELSNAHIIFSDREVNKVKVDGNIDYLRNVKLTEKLMKKYNASEIIFCNDVTERAYICDDIERISFDVVPYSALRGKSSSDQTTAILNQISRNRL